MSDVDAARGRLIEALVSVNPGGSTGYEGDYLDAFLAPGVRADLLEVLGLVGENPYGTDIPGDWAERELHKGWAEGFAAGRATSEEGDTQACLRWTCESCGWSVVVPMPGYAGDGHNHYERPGNRVCGPLVARREGMIRARPGESVPARPAPPAARGATVDTDVLGLRADAAALASRGDVAS